MRLYEVFWMRPIITPHDKKNENVTITGRNNPFSLSNPTITTQTPPNTQQKKSIMNLYNTYPKGADIEKANSYLARDKKCAQ